MQRIPRNRLAKQRGIAWREIRFVRAVTLRDVLGEEISEITRAGSAADKSEKC